MTGMGPKDERFVDRFRLWKHRPKSYSLGSEADLTAQQIYDELMKTVFGPALRAAGLKESGGRFELPSARYWAQLGFQKSAFSGSEDLRFTVNLSVIGRVVWEEESSAKLFLGKRPTPSAHYGSWAEQLRIGQLMPSGEDYWWPLHRSGDASGVAEHVTSVLLELAVPWLVVKSSAEPLRSSL